MQHAPTTNGVLPFASMLLFVALVSERVLVTSGLVEMKPGFKNLILDFFVLEASAGRVIAQKFPWNTREC